MSSDVYRSTGASVNTGSRWMWKPRLSPSPRLRLFCLPYAGGSAAIYRDWLAKMPLDVDVCPIQLPGRAERMAEVPICEPTRLLDALHTALQPWLDRPFVLLGYSMGALIAQGWAHRMTPAQRALLRHVVVAACSPPDHPAHTDPDQMSRAEFVEHLRSLGGTPPEVFEHAELMDLMLPLLEADFRLVARWRASLVGACEQRLDCPIVALSAHQDVHALPEQMAGWSAYTTGEFQQQSVPGEHFALWQQPQWLMEAALKTF
jgi:medium-chain acyl-[acyl-carrier-protein] hydrolase